MHRTQFGNPGPEPGTPERWQCQRMSAHLIAAAPRRLRHSIDRASCAVRHPGALRRLRLSLLRPCMLDPDPGRSRLSKGWNSSRRGDSEKMRPGEIVPGQLLVRPTRLVRILRTKNPGSRKLGIPFIWGRSLGRAPGFPDSCLADWA